MLYEPLSEPLLRNFFVKNSLSMNQVAHGARAQVEQRLSALRAELQRLQSQMPSHGGPSSPNQELRRQAERLEQRIRQGGLNSEQERQLRERLHQVRTRLGQTGQTLGQTGNAGQTFGQGGNAGQLTLEQQLAQLQAGVEQNGGMINQIQGTGAGAGNGVAVQDTEVDLGGIDLGV